MAATRHTHTHTHRPSFGFDASVRLLNLCFVFAGCFVSRDRRQILLPLRCTNSRPTTCVSLSKVTHPHTTFPYPPPQQPRKTMPSLHMSSIADACSLLADDCRRWTQCLFIVVAPCTVRNRNTGLVLASLRCCSRRRSERGTTPPCCGVPAP